MVENGVRKILPCTSISRGNARDEILPFFVREICMYSMPWLPWPHPRRQWCGCRYWPCLLATCTLTNQSFDVSVDSFPPHMASCDFLHFHHATCSSCRTASRSGGGITTRNPQNIDHNQNIPAGSNLRTRTGGANYVNKQVTVYKSNVFSTVVLIWNTVNA